MEYFNFNFRLQLEHSCILSGNTLLKSLANFFLLSKHYDKVKLPLHFCAEQVMMVREWAKERAQWTMAKVWRDGQQYKWQETSSRKGRLKKKWDWSGLRWSEENDAQGLTKSADVNHANEGETKGLAQAGGVAFQHCGECGFMNALWLESFAVFLSLECSNGVQ